MIKEGKEFGDELIAQDNAGVYDSKNSRSEFTGSGCEELSFDLKYHDLGFVIGETEFYI